MSDEPTRIYIEEWSAISPGDLGLKAVFQASEGMEVTFRQIVGWVTYNGRDPGLSLAKSGFLPVVVGDHTYPIAAHLVSGYIGTLPNDITAAGATQMVEDWRKKKTEREDQITINVPGVGKA